MTTQEKKAKLAYREQLQTFLEQTWRYKHQVHDYEEESSLAARASLHAWRRIKRLEWYQPYFVLLFNSSGPDIFWGISGV